jgi:hypothetical protein
MDMAADHDVFDHRHAGEYVRALKRSRQPGARDIVDTQTGNQRVVEMHLAFLRPIEPAHAIHQRGLAGTVWANHSQQFVSADRDRNIVKRDHTAERHSDFIGNKYGRVSARRAGDDGIGLARGTLPLATILLRVLNAHTTPRWHVSPQRGRCRITKGNSQMILMTFCYIILLTHRSNQIKAYSADYCRAHVLVLLANAAMRALTLRQVASSPAQRGHFGKAAESLASKPESFLAFA